MSLYSFISLQLLLAMPHTGNIGGVQIIQTPRTWSYLWHERD